MVRNIRLIARLDVKTKHLVKGVQLEGLRKLGEPNVFAHRYYRSGIDEIIYMDIVASLYERNSLLPIVRDASEDIFIPLTVGGGIRSIGDAGAALNSGADKVAVNTAAVKNPRLISDIANVFGSQCVVASIEAKRTGPASWEVYYDNGREKTGRDTLAWAHEVCERGAGEILVTSVDREGGGRGMDIELIGSVCEMVDVPVVASGGVGSVDHIRAVVDQTHVSAVAVAYLLHYEHESVESVKRGLSDMVGVEFR